MVQEMSYHVAFISLISPPRQVGAGEKPYAAPALNILIIKRKIYWFPASHWLPHPPTIPVFIHKLFQGQGSLPKDLAQELA